MNSEASITKNYISIKLDYEKIVWVAILLFAAVSRFYDLGARVISHDESLHTYYAWELSQGRGFEHSPLMHGPFQFHIVAFSYFLFGDSDFTSRIPSAVFGLAAVGVLWYFRDYLGKVGALVAAGLITISPMMLYYSRYVRNEALVVVWVLIMLLAVAKYFRNRQSKWLYVIAGVTAFNHATKEVAFLYDAIWMLFLGLLFVRDNIRDKWENEILKKVFLSLLIGAVFFGLLVLMSLTYDIAGSVMATKASLANLTDIVSISGMISLGLVALAAAAVFVARWRLLYTYPSFHVLVLISSLVLPQIVAFPVRFLLGSDPLDYSSAGMWRTGSAFVVLVLISFVVGITWDRKKWVVCAGIFYSIYILFFTTVFSNGGGLTSGFVGSLGYWMEQQSVERGSQPWYYYLLVLIPMYEYLPAIGTMVGGWLFTIGWKRDKADRRRYFGNNSFDFPIVSFLIFWCLSAFVIYIYAGEKMPWLTVHLTLPMILISSWAFGSWIRRVDWIRLGASKGLVLSVMLLVVGLVLFDLLKILVPIIVGWNSSGDSVPFQGTTLLQLEDTMAFLASLVVLILATVAVMHLIKQIGLHQFRHITKMLVVVVLCVLTVRTSIIANYIKFDEQTEFINYASGAPGIKIVMEQVEEISRATTDGLGIKIAYDDDVSWPFTWYLRDYNNQVFYGGEPSRQVFQDTPLVIAGNNNWPKVEALLKNNYHTFEYIRMWWPMQDYFGLGYESVLNNITNPERLAALWDIWYRRDYTRYGQINDVDYSLANWPVVDRMRFYVEKTLAAKLWDIGSMTTMHPISFEVDPFESVSVTRIASFVWGSNGNNSGEFNRPRDVAVSSNNEVYVADTFNHRIQKFDKNGNLLLKWGEYGSIQQTEGASRGLNEPWGLAVSTNDMIYVADTWNHRIVKFDSDGGWVTSWGSFGDGVDLYSMWGPREVTIGPDGLVYVADTGNKRISVFTQDGVAVRQIGQAGSFEGELEEPVGVAVGLDGQIYVADTWNARIQVFNNEGSYLREWPVSEWEGQSLDNKPYLAIDNTDRIFATAPEGYRILVWDLYGNPILGWGNFGNDLQSFDLPTGIDLDADGGLYVTDTDNDRVMYFDNQKE
jgi:uncharacterized protein (TIGR03663 family)